MKGEVRRKQIMILLGSGQGRVITIYTKTYSSGDASYNIEGASSPILFDDDSLRMYTQRITRLADKCQWSTSNGCCL